MSTGQNAVMLCGWKVKTGVAHSIVHKHVGVIYHEQLPYLSPLGTEQLMMKVMKVITFTLPLLLHHVYIISLLLL